MFFEKHFSKLQRLPKRRSGCFFEFFYCQFFKERKKNFSKTNRSKKQIFWQTFKTIFSQKNDNAKDDERQCWTFFKNQKKNSRGRVLGILEENVFFSEKWSIFSKEQDWKKQKRKKDETKRRRNTEGWFTERDEKRQRKRRLNENTKVLEKEKKTRYFFEKKLFNKKKKERTNEETRDNESEHQEGTWKEKKHEERQNKKKKKREK